ncbi:MAG: MlaE family lipid ABC transporter permease subunit [Gammaproteobacteria bacterium]
MEQQATSRYGEAGAEIGVEGALIRCSGAWTLRGAAALEAQLAQQSWPSAPELRLDASGIHVMDTAGAWLLHRTIASMRNGGRRVQVEGLHPDHRTLLDTIGALARAQQEVVEPQPDGLLTGIGKEAVTKARFALRFLSFIGESARAMLRWVMQPRRVRWRAFLHELQLAGFNALPITGLLAFLMGIVIAYQGADQLRRFGADIFIADLVGLSMLRELAPILTAIIVAGRSGSAYTAQIGTMKVTEEIDALRTIGVPPLDLLVLPKMLALTVALPLLTVFADIVGVLGGMVMASLQLGVSSNDFLERLRNAIDLSSFMVGVGKAPVFAAIVSLVGCYQGFQVTGSADSVGRRTTVSVVQGIFLVIVVDALFSVAFSWLGI